MYELNNDFIGWLKIENTNINYPIMQTDSNRKDYYLKRNFYKEYSQLGTPYIAEFCDVLKSDNLIIYGHHISNYQMFGEEMQDAIGKEVKRLIDTAYNDAQEILRQNVETLHAIAKVLITKEKINEEEFNKFFA